MRAGPVLIENQNPELPLLFSAPVQKAGRTLEKELGHVIELDKLLKGIRNGPSPQRKKASTRMENGAA